MAIKTVLKMINNIIIKSTRHFQGPVGIRRSVFYQTPNIETLFFIIFTYKN